MFELIPDEITNLRCHFGTSSWGGTRYLPMAFTKLRRMLATHDDLRRIIEDMEAKYDEQFRVVFEALRQLLETEEQPKRRIGFMKEKGRKFKRSALQDQVQLLK